MEPGVWEAKVRPVLPLALETIYLAGKAPNSPPEIAKGRSTTWELLVDRAWDEGGSD